jgi:ATP-binding cassette, subfamily B, bacterial
MRIVSDGIRARLAVARLYPQIGKGFTAAVVALVLISPLLSLGYTLAAGYLVGSVPAAVRDGIDSAAGRRLLTALAAVGATFIAQYALGGLREVLAQIAGRRVSRMIKRRVLGAMLRPPGVAHVEDPEVLDKIAAARGQTAHIDPGSAATGIVQLVVNRLAVVPPALLLATFRWWLPIVMGAGLVWMRVVMRRHIMNAVNARMGQTSLLRQARYFVDLSLTPQAAKETRIFDLGPWFGDRFRSLYLSAMAAIWKERAGSRRRLVVPWVAAMGTSALGYWLVTTAALDGELSLARLTILLTATGGMRGVLAIGNEDVYVEQGAASLPLLREVEELAADRVNALSGSLTATDMPKSSVRFERVCFRYPGSEHDVYAGLDLEIRSGESLAVVGINGAGKTTLVKLLSRLYDPSDGRITVDGTDLRDLDPEQWQRRVAAIFQDFTRYELTAADNVGFGAIDLIEDREALADAASQAGALDIIEALPEGWDTTLSRRFTDGVDLSGGEWQRVALARAVLAVRAGAGILVLDEPTANLDVRAEAELYERFLELTRGVTTIVISHRFSTVRRADRIVVLDGGRVVEEGTHDELVDHGGHYARMFQLQAARFAEVGNG